MDRRLRIITAASATLTLATATAALVSLGAFDLFGGADEADASDIVVVTTQVDVTTTAGATPLDATTTASALPAPAGTAPAPVVVLTIPATVAGPASAPAVAPAATVAPAAATTSTTLPPGARIPSDWPADKPIPPIPPGCRKPVLEDNGVWNCDH